MSLFVLEQAATALGLEVVDGPRVSRFYLAKEGDLSLDSWVELGRGGCFILGPGFTYEEGEELRAALRDARKGLR